MKTISLKHIKALKREAQGECEELRKLDRIEKEEQAKVDQLLDEGGLEDPKKQSELASARLKLDLIPGRRRKLRDWLPRAVGELSRDVDLARQEWNRAVAERVQVETESVRRALEPFFPDRKRQLNRALDALNVPSVDAIRAAHSHSPFYGPEAGPEDRIRNAENFISRVQRFAKLIGVAVVD